MTPFSLPHLGIFDFLAFRTLTHRVADNNGRKDVAHIFQNNSNNGEERPQIYIRIFFPLF
ncbi:hypothetical protein J2858_004128 [Neorhizobium galegae]|uniref:hypothetical protein n=1 Tax=Neorhizobium galegae TaxID=399 RepID=UPI001AE8A803|nr:hypothetical protein [Neorhizobium galegae]MBP2551188.1 hypothetical protein [Neorhizobium galegae]